MVHCGPLWSIVVHCGPLWSIVVHCGPLWSIVVHCGPLRSIVVHYGPLWSIEETLFRRNFRESKKFATFLCSVGIKEIFPRIKPRIINFVSREHFERPIALEFHISGIPWKFVSTFDVYCTNYLIRKLMVLKKFAE